MTLYIVGFDDFVTSIIATIATGRGDPCRVGLTPTERPCLRTAHRKLHCMLEHQFSHQMTGRAALKDWQARVEVPVPFQAARRLSLISRRNNLWSSSSATEPRCHSSRYH